MTSVNLRISRRAVMAMVGSAGLMRFSPAAFAQSYPDRPVKIIVPFAPGGPTDIMARLFAAKLSENTGKQFYVENQGGGGGSIGIGAAAHAAPDGFTVLLCSVSFVTIPALYKKASYDPIKDFAPITMVADCPQAFYVHPSVPAKTMKDLIALAKANPGKYNYATGGTGTLAHLCGELLKLTYGLDLPHVPHRSAGPAIQSTLGGHVPVGVNSLPSSKALMQSGELRGLGITSATRFPSTPEIPTLTEQGIAGLEASNWQAFMVPAGTPLPIVNFLYGEIAKIVKDPGIRNRFIELGFMPIDTTPDQLAQQVKAEVQKWAKVIREAKIEVQ